MCRPACRRASFLSVRRTQERTAFRYSNPRLPPDRAPLSRVLADRPSMGASASYAVIVPAVTVTRSHPYWSNSLHIKSSEPDGKWPAGTGAKRLVDVKPHEGVARAG